MLLGWAAGSAGRLAGIVVGTGEDVVSRVRQGAQRGEGFEEQVGPGCVCGQVQHGSASGSGQAPGDGGPSAANARLTVFRPTPSRRAIALIGIPSAR